MLAGLPAGSLKQEKGMDVSRADGESRQIFGVYASGLTNVPGADKRPRAQSVTEAGRACPPVRAGPNPPRAVEIRFRLVAEARRIRHLATDGRSRPRSAVVRDTRRHVGRETEAGGIRPARRHRRYATGVAETRSSCWHKRPSGCCNDEDYARLKSA